MLVLEAQSEKYPVIDILLFEIELAQNPSSFIYRLESPGFIGGSGIEGG
jgi:hypothetical protein